MVVAVRGDGDEVVAAVRGDEVVVAVMRWRWR